MIDLFANSGWKDGLVTGNSFYLKKINELHNRLSQLQIVEQFHYISNPNSLIHWALTYVFILLSSFLRLSSSTFGRIPRFSIQRSVPLIHILSVRRAAPFAVLRVLWEIPLPIRYSRVL